MIPVHGLHLATAAPLCILNQQYGLFGADLAYQWCRAIQTGSHKLLFKGHSPKPFPYLPSFPFTYLLRLTGMEKGVNEKKLYTRMKIPGEISMLKSYNERIQKFSGGIPMKKFSFVFCCLHLLDYPVCRGLWKRGRSDRSRNIQHRNDEPGCVYPELRDPRTNHCVDKHQAGDLLA